MNKIPERGTLNVNFVKLLILFVFNVFKFISVTLLIIYDKTLCFLTKFLKKRYFSLEELLKLSSDPNLTTSARCKKLCMLCVKKLEP